MVPEEIEVITATFDRLNDGETPVELESFLLTKHGDHLFSKGVDLNRSRFIQPLEHQVVTVEG